MLKKRLGCRHTPLRSDAARPGSALQFGEQQLIIDGIYDTGELGAALVACEAVALKPATVD